jgi:hypothetical protein
MSIDPQIRRVAARGNLDLAWLRLRTSTEPAYREYFRPLYRAFGVAADEHLDVLHDALIGGYYEPSPATKVYFPKPSGLQRVYTLLTVEDHVVYQAIANTIADRLHRRFRERYLRSVFGHIYAGPGNPFFYRDWRSSYKSYAGAIRRAFKDGYLHTASFDLTACYDSIDHGVLEHFLGDLGVSLEVSRLLCKMLHQWTGANPAKPIHHSHGIPQGPVPSGLLAEVVLAYFDSTARKKGLRYFRYVDDIRLFAKDEFTLRHELIALDIKSKEVGLFPQSSKVSIHRVTNIEEEIKGVSQPAGTYGTRVVVDQRKLKKALISLSPRFRVANQSQFKYDLGGAAPNSALILRLLAILDREPSFYYPVCRYIARCPRVSRKASRELLKVLRSHDLYPGFAAGLLRCARENLHRDAQPTLFAYCKSRLKGRRSSRSPEVRAAAAAVLLWNRQLTWQESRDVLAWKDSWWLRAWTPGFLRPDHIGVPSYEAIIHDLLRDEASGPALVGAELLVTHRLAVPRPMRDVNPAAQRTLLAVGKIGRVQHATCPIRTRVVRTLGAKMRPVVWTKIFDARTYRLMITRVAVWASYATTDSTAWVVLTDTMNDILLDALHKHDSAIGSYSLGNIGSAMQPTSRLAKKYPKLYAIIDRVHDLRLGADLAHPVTRSTNAPTSRIPFREMRKLLRPLEAGYLELWQHW